MVIDVIKNKTLANLFSPTILCRIWKDGAVVFYIKLFPHRRSFWCWPYSFKKTYTVNKRSRILHLEYLLTHLKKVKSSEQNLAFRVKK